MARLTGQANGLVDELGGLDTAIDLVKKKANIPAAEQVSLMTYPARHSILDVILRRSEEEDMMESKIARALGRMPFHAWMKGGYLRLMPYWVDVR